MSFFRRSPEIDNMHFARTVKAINKMNPYQFEGFLKELFESMGYDAQRTQSTRDNGVDLFIKKKGYTYVVQAKKYASTTLVTAKDIRDFIGCIDIHRADGGYFVTTGSYSIDAKKQLDLYRDNLPWLNSGKDIELWDYTILRDNIRRHYCSK